MKLSALAWSASFASIVLALPLVQCSFVTSLDGLTGGTGDAGTHGGQTILGDDASVASNNDAGASRGDASLSPALTADAASDDAGAIDAGATDANHPPLPTSSDGGGDSGSEPTSDDAGADATADAAVLLFSDDFATPAALPRAWDTMTTMGGTLALDTATSPSASPSSWLEATAFPLDAGAPGDSVNITLRKRFPMPAAGATVAYDLAAIVQQYDQANHANAVLAALQVADDAGDLYELQLDAVLGGSATSLAIVFAEYAGLAEGGSTYVPHPVSVPIATAVWTSIRIELTASQPPLARLYFDGELALETTITIPIVGTATQISLGISYASAPTAPWVVSYDDVAYWATP